MAKKKIIIPKFKNEKEERKFWSNQDLSKYFARQNFESVSFPDLKPTSRAISIRIHEYLLIRLKEKANALQIPFCGFKKLAISEHKTVTQHKSLIGKLNFI